MAFSSKQENDYKNQLEQIAAEVDSYIVKTDGVLEYFREQIRPLAQRWKTYHEVVDRRKKELSDHWEKVKKNSKLQDKNMKPSEELEWDRFYLHGLGSFGSNPINEMPAKYALDVMAALEKYLERNEKNEQGYSENSSEYKRLQETIAEQRQDLEDIHFEFDKLSSAEKKSVWIKTPPKTVIPNKIYCKFTWWRYLNLPDETVFGCWRPPLIPLPEYPLNILKPVESEYQISQARKELPDARNAQEEYERYYIFLSSVHDNFLQGVEKITEGIWSDNLPIAVLCCLDKGHGDKTAFLKAALERVCQSNHKTDKKKEQETRDDGDTYNINAEHVSLGDKAQHAGRDINTITPEPKKEKGGWGLVKKISLILGIFLTILLIIWTFIQIRNHYKEDTSKTPPKQIETPKIETKQIAENKLDLSLRNICRDIDSRPLALQAETEKQYLGLRIKRERLKVLEVEINPGDESIYNLGLTIPDQPTFPNSKWIILCTISKDLYPQLRGAREGMEFYLSGEIETTFRRDRVPYICLSNVTLEFE